MECPTCHRFFAYSPTQPNKRFCSSKCIRKIPDHAAHFWAIVKKSANACWIWPRTLNNKGYGMIGMPGAKTILTHRYAWQLTNGQIPEGVKVLHNCPGGDNPACCNPRHLRLGTMKENTQDAREKGTMAVGESHPRHKLRECDVKAIRRFYEDGFTMRSIGQRYGVTHEVVRKIVRGISWVHVK